MDQIRKGVGYVRKSQVRKDADVPGLERQQAAIEEWCRQHGVELVKVFEERKSAWGSKGQMRPSLRDAIEAVRTERAQMLLTWRTDRLTRGGLIGLGKILEPLHDNGAFFKSTSESVSSETAQERMMLGLHAGIAETESDNTSKRIRAAREQEAKEGRSHGGPRPFGLNAQRDGWDPVEAEIIREAARRMIDEGATLVTIAEDWNARGIKAPRGGAWQPTTVSKIFKSKRLIGIREHNGANYPAVWGPLLTVEDFTALEQAVRSRRPGTSKASSQSLLAGILRCGRCGQKMYAGPNQRGNALPRYRCKGDQAGGGCNLSISRPPVDAAVVSNLLRLMDEIEASGDPIREDGSPASTIEEDREALQRLLDLYLRGKVDEDLYLAQHERLTASIKRAEKLEKEPKILAFGTDWWAQASEPERRKALQDILLSVEVAHVGYAGAKKNPADRLTINLRSEWLREAATAKAPSSAEMFRRLTKEKS